MIRFAILSALAVLLIGTFAADVSAHAVGVDCTLRLGKLEIEVFYDDDSAAQQARVELVNDKDEVIATTTTDKLGRCTLPMPAQGKYEVRVDAGAGHRAKKKIDVPASTTESPVAPTTAGSVENSTRAEFTRFPWEKLVIGFVVISALSGAFVLGSVIRRHATSKG